MGDPLADGDGVVDLGEAGEGGPAGGSAGAPHVEGDGEVAPLGEPGGDAAEQALEPAQHRVGVDEHHRQVLRRGIRGLEDPRVELHPVARLHRRRRHGRGARRS